MKQLNNNNTDTPELIMISMSRWDGAYSSAALSLAKEFAKSRKVYYFDQPFTLYDVIKQFRNSAVQSRLKPLIFGKQIYKQPYKSLDNFIVVTPMVMLPINWLPESKLYRVFQKFNNFIFFRTLRKVIKENNLKDYIFFNTFNPFYANYIPKDIRPAKFIYQTRDDISVSEYVYKHGVALERQAVMNADIVLATSKELTRKLSKYCKEVIQLPNAADTSLFKYEPSKEYKRPNEIQNVDTSIIGYIGNFDERVDFDLFYEIVMQNKHKTILVVGPRNDENSHNYDFDSLNNIVFTGSKNINDLPGYLCFMDCTIIPFKVNKLTKSIYPLKINEYLAGGKPVVTTNFSEDIREFKDCIYLCNSKESFIESISEALENTNNGIESRVAMAAKNSWENRAEQFWEILYLNE